MTTAKEPTSSTPSESASADSNILDRIAAIAERNPGMVALEIDTEALAGEILLALAATLRKMIADVGLDRDDVQTCRKHIQEYRKAFFQKKALEYLHELADEDAIEIGGARLRAVLPTVQ